MVNIYTKYFYNHSKNEQDIAWTNPDGRAHDHTRTHTHTCLYRYQWEDYDFKQDLEDHYLTVEEKDGDKIK